MSHYLGADFDWSGLATGIVDSAGNIVTKVLDNKAATQQQKTALEIARLGSGVPMLKESEITPYLPYLAGAVGLTVAFLILTRKRR